MAAQIDIASRVQVMFTVTDSDRPDGLSFTDALYYPVGQVPANAVVRAAGLARYNAWRAALDVRPPRPSRAERIQAARESRDALVAQAAVAEAVLAAEQESQESLDP